MVIIGILGFEYVNSCQLDMMLVLYIKLGVFVFQHVIDISFYQRVLNTIMNTVSYG